MPDDYEVHRQRQMAEARDAFRGFVEASRGDKRLRLAAIGAPEDDSQANCRDKDAADLPAASYRVDMADAVDGFADELCEALGIDEAKARWAAEWMTSQIETRALSYRASDLNRISGVFIDTNNPKLFSAGLAFAADLAAINGLGSQAEYARKIGLSRSAVSKVTKFWQRLLNLPPSRHMKGEKACASYALAQKSKHWRKRKADSAGLQQLTKRYERKTTKPLPPS